MSTPNRAFAGKTALVTGGSRGLGEFMAEALVRAGVRVYVSSRKADACAATAAELSKHGECLSLPADLSTSAEVERLAQGRGYIQVDSYRTAEQREIFMSWVLTAKFHDYPAGWIQLFREAGYTGDWNWTIIE